MYKRQTVDNEIIGKIGKGFLVLIGISQTDTKEIADKLIRKMTGLRIFDDEDVYKRQEYLWVTTTFSRRFFPMR